MTNQDLQDIGRDLASATKAYVARMFEKGITQLNFRVDDVKLSLDALQKRVAEVQLTPGPPGQKGDPGADGAAGRDGIDGTNGTNGTNGKDGEPGRDGVDGKDGSDGAAGIDGSNGKDGTNGKDGRDGVDGKSVTVEDIEGVIEIAITKALVGLERRAVDQVQRAIDQIPPPVAGKDGKDGRDGVGHDDIDEHYEDDGRVLVRRFMRDGAVVKELKHVTKQVVYRSTYEEGRTYRPGDAVTWGGAMWIAKDETTAKPGQEGLQASRAWQLAVRRGAEGARGPEGKAGPRGPAREVARQ